MWYVDGGTVPQSAQEVVARAVLDLIKNRMGDCPDYEFYIHAERTYDTPGVQYSLVVAHKGFEVFTETVDEYMKLLDDNTFAKLMLVCK